MKMKHFPIATSISVLGLILGYYVIVNPIHNKTGIENHNFKPYFDVEEIEYKGHTYIVLEHHDMFGVTHSGSCKCREENQKKSIK